MEACPKCRSVYIQFDNHTNECYCLVKDCGHRWKQSLIRNKVVNMYLRNTMYKEHSEWLSTSIN